MHPDRAYFSIEAWPESFDEARRTDAMRTLLTVELFRAKELARRSVPAMMARTTISLGDQAARQFREWGGSAASISGTDIAALQTPLYARTASEVGPEFEFALWRGDPLRIDPAKITALVRAHPRVRKGHVEADFGVHALHQLHGTLGAEAWSQGHTGRSQVQIGEVLDIHTLGGIHLRLAGERFGFEVLGDRRADTDRENLDLLAAVLIAKAPGRSIDLGFENARFLGEFARDFGITGDWKSAGGFAVYSAWRACMAMALRAGDPFPA